MLQIQYQNECDCIFSQQMEEEQLFTIRSTINSTNLLTDAKILKHMPFTYTCIVTNNLLPLLQLHMHPPRIGPMQHPTHSYPQERDL